MDEAITIIPLVLILILSLEQFAFNRYLSYIVPTLHFAILKPQNRSGNIVKNSVRMKAFTCCQDSRIAAWAVVFL